MVFYYLLYGKQGLTFYTKCLLRRKPVFHLHEISYIDSLGDNLHEISRPVFHLHEISYLLFDISCKLTHKETFMKCQILISGENKIRNAINFSSAEFV